MPKYYANWLHPQNYQFYHLDDVTLMAYCLYGEAAGEPPVGQKAVACVIRNRVLGPSWWGRSYREVILRPWQFSSFNPGSPRVKAMLEHSNTKVWNTCLDISFKVIEENDPDITGGATHFHTIKAPKDHKGPWPPPWSKQMVHTCDIKRHRFYHD